MNEISKEVSNEIINLIKSKPNCVLGLATGSSPLGVYFELIRAFNNKEVSFKDVTTFNLDEYIGLKEDDLESYRYFMNSNLFNHIDIDINKTNVPNAFVKDDIESLYYDELIDEYGGIDLQILGLGSDGHIAFNEPGTSFNTLTHITNLTEQTIMDNSRFFKTYDEVPKKAITMGLKSIINARKIILIVSGKSKEKAINDFLYNEISECLPCSILKKHNNLTVYIDNELILK